MRILIAGVLGGLVFLVWSTLAHTVLPLGYMGMKLGTPHEAVLAALKQDATLGEGVYVLPSLPPEKMMDEQAMKDFAPIETSHPYAFVIYQPQGRDSAEMGANIGTQAASNVLAGWLVAFVLAAGAFGFGKRVGLAVVMGVFAWMTVSVPWWNWYRFPSAFILESLIEQVIGWLLAGLVMAWWLGRKGQ
jgi:hypothetical protein